MTILFFPFVFPGVAQWPVTFLQVIDSNDRFIVQHEEEFYVPYDTARLIVKRD